VSRFCFCFLHLPQDRPKGPCNICCIHAVMSPTGQAQHGCMRMSSRLWRCMQARRACRR
jgi:hypothetical protein